MILSDSGNLVFGQKFSTVVPARVTSENTVRGLGGMDLAMKLHYLRGVYYFRSDAVRGLGIGDFKKPMFKLLELYHTVAGRIRRSETGRPFIKCNDSGVRIGEAQCSKSLEEWLDMGMADHSHNLLASSLVLGPELSFSPLVLVQFTWFKCGGMAVGLSWAHVVGDAFSASSFLNMWGQIIAGHLPPESLNLPNLQTKAGDSNNLVIMDHLPLKQVKPVGDYWVTPTSCKMGKFTFQITAKQLKQIQTKICGQSKTSQVPPFEALCAVIWISLAKAKEGPEPKTVTVCRKNSYRRENGRLSNNQKICVIKADDSVVGANPSELATQIAEQMVDEKGQVEEIVERDQGLSDFIFYGVNLTFVDFEGAELYGLELNGQKPVSVDYTVDGVGDEGVVLVLPGPENVREEDAGGRTVTIILQQNHLEQLKYELEMEWFIA